MLPTRVADWNLDLVRSVAAEYIEFTPLEFKEKLPHKKDDKGKLRLKKTCCAFANGQGGYIIFGVADEGHPKSRTIVGMEPSSEFGEQFGVYPNSCVPTVDWTMRNPPIELEDGRVIHIVHVGSSSRGPHAVLLEPTPCFMVRTDKGNEHMTYDGITEAFFQRYDRQVGIGAKLAAFLSEVSANMFLLDVVDDTLTKAMAQTEPSLRPFVVLEDSALKQAIALGHGVLEAVELRHLYDLQLAIKALNCELEIWRLKISPPLDHIRKAIPVLKGAMSNAARDAAGALEAVKARRPHSREPVVCLFDPAHRRMLSAPTVNREESTNAKPE
jgi:hypothetical protein